VGKDDRTWNVTSRIIRKTKPKCAWTDSPVRIKQENVLTWIKSCSAWRRRWLMGSTGIVLAICSSDWNIDVGLHISVGLVSILALTSSSGSSVVLILAAIRTSFYVENRTGGFVQRYREHQSPVTADNEMWNQ